MADDRTYIKLHDGMPDHPKVDPLSDAAFRALISGWCWCSRHLTDGRMPARTWEKRATARVRRELLSSGLVEAVDDGVLWHDYLEHQRSAEQVAAMKEQRRAAGRSGGLAKGKRVAKRTASDLLSEMPSKTEAETEGSSNEEPQTEGSSARKRVAKKATPPPDVFPITEQMAEWGRANCPLVTDPQAETRQFLDHARANGKAFIDWTAAWRTWMSNAQKYAVQRGGNVRQLAPKQMPSGTDPHLAHLYEQS